MLVAKRRRPHVAQADGPLAAAVDKRVAVLWVELGRCDHFGQFLHIGWLDVNNVWRSGGKDLNANALFMTKTCGNTPDSHAGEALRAQRILKLQSVISRFHRLMRRSSADR